MAGKSDDERDDFVTIGTPLPQYDEDEHISRKPIAVHEQVVRDAQGRIRFHGAFTGGFSAGYFNTVDTKEGWAPKTFKSSKFERSRQENVQKPEDFMDEEDFGEFGIAPKKLATKDKYKTCREEVRSQNQMTATEQADAFSLFTSSHLVHCLKPTRATIGMRLLRKLGWRHGRGVGTKAKRWKRMNKTSNPSSVAKRAYGCELPPELMMLHKKVNDDDDDDEDGDGNDDDQLSAEDICPINFTIKCDLHGLGYRGIDVNDALITKDRLREAAKRSDGVMRRMNKGIKGQAFGVGALEDEDEDVYSVDNPMIYDTSIPTSLEDDVHHAAAVDDDDGRGGQLHGWTAPKHLDAGFISSSKDGRNVLPGFKPSCTPLLPPRIHHPPTIPPGFKPFHNASYKNILEVASVGVAAAGEEGGGAGKSRHWQNKNRSFLRGQQLGEAPHINSVFELVSSKDKARIEAAKMNIDLKKMEMKKKEKQTTVDDETSNSSTTSSSNFRSEVGSRSGNDTGTTSNNATTLHDESIQLNTTTTNNKNNNINNNVLNSVTTDDAICSNKNLNDVQLQINNTNQPQIKSEVADLVSNVNNDSNTTTSTCVNNTLRNINSTDLLKDKSTFKPFARDPEKQKRYEMYLQSLSSCSDSGNISAAQSYSNCSMMEWEIEHEREEFKQACKLFRPMSSMISTRFVSARLDDDDKDDDANKDTDSNNNSKLSDKEAAVVKKMFGRLTRECTLWHPAKLLCVRFNVEDPYPDSVIVGLPVSKKAKHSIFNFLQHNFTTSGDVIKNDNDVEQSLNIKTVDADSNRKPPTQATKPLAILSKVDLRVPQSSSSSEAAVSNIHLIPADDVMSRNQQLLEIKSTTTLATSTTTTTSIVATAATSTAATDVACGGSNDRDDDDDGGGGSVGSASGENVEIKRPSIDLFKAIFEDDDDDEDEVGNGNDEETYDDTDKVDVDATSKSSPTSDNFISFNSSNLDQNSTTSGAVLNISDDCIASAENYDKTPKNESTVRPGSIISTTFSSFQATPHLQRHFFKPPDKKEKDSHDPAKHKKSRKHKSSDKHKKHKKSKKSKKKNHKRDQSSDDDDSDSDEDAHRHNDEHKHSKKDEKLLSKLKRYSLTLPH